MEGKYDLFNKVSDRRDIVDFVKEIEKYPCLYDTTLAEYANKFHNRKAWSTIAKKINTTVPDCRDKWRKIRISFMRSLKQHQSDKPPMRPYYLSEELQFLRPFLKINVKSPNQREDNEELMDYDISSVQKHEVSESDSSDPFLDDDKQISKVMIKDNKERPKEIIYVREHSRNGIVDEKLQIRNSHNDDKQHIRNGHSDERQHIRNSHSDERQHIRNSHSDERQHLRNSHSDEKQHNRNSYSDDIEANPRKMFLLSLLPDVECFTESEMRIFRREVINVCDDIINRREI